MRTDFVTLALGLVVMSGCIAAVIAVHRRKRAVPFYALFIGICGVVFFSRMHVLALAGVVVSVAAVSIGAALLMFRRTRPRKDKLRRVYVLTDSGVWRFRGEEYFSASGRWRRAS